MEIDREIQEFQEEQEKASVKPSNQQGTTQVVEEAYVGFRGSYYADPYLEDMNPMNGYIIIDLPWPKTSKD